ncbi:MAG: hypothetical protein ACYTG5_12000 [Planctomycetota bacterium]
MNFAISFQEQPRLFTVTTTGVASAEGFEAFTAELLDHRNWRPGTAILIDHSRAVTNQLSIDDIHMIAKSVTQLAERTGSAPLALIMATDVAFGMARMWQQLTELDSPMQISIFRSMAEARPWLEQLAGTAASE